MRSTLSLRRFSNIALETVQMLVRLTMIRSHLLNEGRRPFSFYVSLLLAIDGVMSMCQQALSQAHQHFRFSKMQAICGGWLLPPVVGGCFSCQPIYTVISGMSKAVHPQGVWKVDVEHQRMPVWASHSTFHFL